MNTHKMLLFRFAHQILPWALWIKHPWLCFTEEEEEIYERGKPIDWMHTANSLEVRHQLRVLFVPGLTGMSKLHFKQTILERASYEWGYEGRVQTTTHLCLDQSIWWWSISYSPHKHTDSQMLVCLHPYNTCQHVHTQTQSCLFTHLSDPCVPVHALSDNTPVCAHLDLYVQKYMHLFLAL